MRSRLLMMASEFAHQPEAVKKDVTHPASSYSFGWSHGKEIMNGKPDFAKGSYYNNPMVNMPQKCRLEGYSEKYPYYGFPNLWPTDGALPNLEPAFMEVRVSRVQQAHLHNSLNSSSHPSKILYFKARAVDCECGDEIGYSH